MNDQPNFATSPKSALSRRNLLRAGVAGSLVVLGGSALLRSSGALPTTRVTRPLMGTLADIVVAYRGPEARHLARAALDAIQEVEIHMTRFDPASEVGRVNAGAGRFFPVSPMTARVTRTALEIARASDGRFDPGLGALSASWGFSEDLAQPGQALPPFPQVAEGSIPAYQGVELARRGRQHLLRVGAPSIQLDFGGIAKGFAIDRAVALLREHDVRHALVNVGGDLYALGGHPEGRPWQIGVRHPRLPGEFLTVLPLKDRGIATSGDYERFFLKDGLRYHHLMDPRTGRPAVYHQSVTVTAPTVMIADGLATAAFTSPPAQARRLLHRMAPGRWITVEHDGALPRG